MSTPSRGEGDVTSEYLKKWSEWFVYGKMYLNPLLFSSLFLISSSILWSLGFFSAEIDKKKCCTLMAWCFFKLIFDTFLGCELRRASFWRFSIGPKLAKIRARKKFPTWAKPHSAERNKIATAKEKKRNDRWDSLFVVRCTCTILHIYFVQFTYKCVFYL